MTKSGNLTLALAERWGEGEAGKGWIMAFILMNTGVLIPLQNKGPFEYFRKSRKSIFLSYSQ